MNLYITYPRIEFLSPLSKGEELNPENKTRPVGARFVNRDCIKNLDYLFTTLSFTYTSARNDPHV